jgi:hypothetical protein
VCADQFVAGLSNVRLSVTVQCCCLVQLAVVQIEHHSFTQRAPSHQRHKTDNSHSAVHLLNICCMTCRNSDVDNIRGPTNKPCYTCQLHHVCHSTVNTSLLLYEALSLETVWCAFHNSDNTICNITIHDIIHKRRENILKHFKIGKILLSRQQDWSRGICGVHCQGKVSRWLCR